MRPKAIFLGLGRVGMELKRRTDDIVQQLQDCARLKVITLADHKLLRVLRQNEVRRHIQLFEDNGKTITSAKSIASRTKGTSDVVFSFGSLDGSIRGGEEHL